MLRSVSDLRGFAIQATDGEIGTVEDVYFDDQEWMVRYLVVNTGSWLDERLVLIAPESAHRPDWSERVLPVALTKQQVKDSPDIDLEKPVSRQQQIAMHNYYDWSRYWESLPVPLGPSQPSEQPSDVSVAEKEKRHAAERHLRSADEVDGYDLIATDGEIGHVDDFLVEDETWVIRYLVVDTRDWLPGRDVLIASDWVEAIDWKASAVRVEVTKNEVRNSPEYDATMTPGREYESRLHEYYDRAKYWV